MSEVAPDAVAIVAERRREIAAKYLTGVGVEVGAGNRPFAVPPGVTVVYGDIRDAAALEQYFSGATVSAGEAIDAQTFAGLPDDSLDFVISAHVIEHLRDPLGSIVHALRVLKPGGIKILAVPDMRFTFDRRRPEVTVEHVLRDYADGGESTCGQAYEEHLRFVHPELTGQEYSEAEIQWQITESVRRWRELDIHFHAWTRAGFEALLEAAKSLATFEIVETVSVGNENIFVLRKP